MCTNLHNKNGNYEWTVVNIKYILVVQMRERGTGVCSLPLNTKCHLLGINYRPECPAINLILQFIDPIRS